MNYIGWYWINDMKTVQRPTTSLAELVDFSKSGCAGTTINWLWRRKSSWQLIWLQKVTICCCPSTLFNLSCSLCCNSPSKSLWHWNSSSELTGNYSTRGNYTPESRSPTLDCQAATHNDSPVCTSSETKFQYIFHSFTEALEGMDFIVKIHTVYYQLHCNTLPSNNKGLQWDPGKHNLQPISQKLSFGEGKHQWGNSLWPSQCKHGFD